MASGGRKNHLSVMLVHAPVALVQVAKRDASSGLKMCDPTTGEPVKQVYVNPATGERFDRGELGRAVEVSKGVYRQVPPGAMEAIEGTGVEAIDIKATRPLADLPLERVKDRHWVQPEGGAVKALGLVYGALRGTGRFALAKAVVGTRERLLALVPRNGGLLALSLHHADEVHLADEDTRAPVDILAEVSELEMGHAMQLMLALDDVDDFMGTARDEAGAKRADIIAAVLANETLPTVGGVAEATATPVADLDEMLAASLRELNPKPKTGGKRKRKAAVA